MSDVLPFPNPPITEAIFDIKVNLPKETTLESLFLYQKNINDRFPKKVNRRKMEGGFQFSDGLEPKVLSPKDEVYGYHFVASDDSKIVQARLDGFTFNKLKPYSDWDQFSGEAMELWQKFIPIAKPERVNRLSLRYINRIELPLPFFDLKEFILTGPELASNLNLSLAQFFIRMIIPDASIGAFAIVTEAIEDEDKTKNVLPLIFDIDVIQNVNLDPKSPEIFETMKRLRDFKNKLFLESLTDMAKELFK